MEVKYELVGWLVYRLISILLRGFNADLGPRVLQSQLGPNLPVASPVLPLLQVWRILLRLNLSQLLLLDAAIRLKLLDYMASRILHLPFPEKFSDLSSHLHFHLLLIVLLLVYLVQIFRLHDKLFIVSFFRLEREGNQK